MSIYIGRGERMAILGSTGSGKTQMLLAQLKSYPTSPIYILNTKGDISIIDFIDKKIRENRAVNVHNISDMIREGKKRGGMDYIHILPQARELGDPELLDNYLGAIYAINAPCLVCIDEIYQVNVGMNGGPGLNGLLTRGRSKGMSVICCSQRPVFMSKFVMTESQTFLVYRLNNPKDYEKIREMGVPFPKNKSLEKYYFFCYKAGDDSGNFYAPIKIDFDAGYTAQSNNDKRWI